MADSTDPTPDDATVRIESSTSGRARRFADRDPADRYTPGELLGRGGMGEVVLVHDEVLGRDVALKRLLPDRTERESEERFVLEATIQARLQHPAIVPVHDVGQWDGRPFFTMRAIRGKTLTELLAEEGGSPRSTTHRLLSLLERVSLAVHYAHARGVIHRDLKPSNIMVGELGEVYVLDWGVARSGDLAPPTGETVQAVVEGADATRHGTVIGSVAYMAPEQLAGRLDRIGPATDVYALGAIAFEALTGHRVHPAEPPRRPEDAVDVAARLRAHDSDLAPELTVVIQRALARDVDERLGSARELAEAFERFTAGDRDRERREALSREAAARARSKLGHGAPHARADAMREVGRALALDPDNHTAIEVLVDLLSTPPLEVPEEVESALEETVSRGTRTMARTAMWAYAVVPPFFLVALWMGVRDIRVLALIAAVVAVAIGVIALGRRRQHGRRSLAPSLVLASSFIALSSGVFGPFVITPLLTQVAFAFFVLHLGARHLPHLIALAAAVVLVPAGLQWASVLPSSYRFEAGELVVSPIFVEFPPVPTLVMLAGGSVAALAVGLASLAAFRLLLRDAERRAQMQAWQISRLLPEVRQGVGRFVGG